LTVLVKEIMATKVISLPADRNVREAAELMTRADVGSVLVYSDGAPAGIVTERDVVRKIVAEGIDASRVLVTDIMSTPVVTVPSSSTTEEAAEKMATYNIRYLPVVEDGEVVGVLAAKDIARVLAKEQNFADIRLNAIAGVKSGDLPPPYG
jgi:CBS domain-containing protein